MTKKSEVDPQVKKFFEENRAMIEELLEQERQRTKEALEADSVDPKEFVDYHADKARETVDKERELVKGLATKGKEKADETLDGVIGALLNPEVQKHVVSAGIEMMLALDSIVRSFPMPDRVREAADKAQETRDAMTKAYCSKNPDCGAKKSTKKKSAQKIDIEMDEE